MPRASLGVRWTRSTAPPPSCRQLIGARLSAQRDPSHAHMVSPPSAADRPSTSRTPSPASYAAPVTPLLRTPGPDGFHAVPSQAHAPAPLAGIITPPPVAGPHPTTSMIPPIAHTNGLLFE